MHNRPDMNNKRPVAIAEPRAFATSTFEGDVFVADERTRRISHVPLEPHQTTKPGWEYPTTMGDCETEDVWYPHLLSIDPSNKEGEELDREAGDFCLVDDLTGTVFIRPSRFDFEFLDTTGRRFEISYGKDGRRPLRRTRPFLLDDLERLAEIWGEMKHLHRSQRHQVIQSIEATREAWYGSDAEGKSWSDPVFEQFVRDTLSGAAWRDHPWKGIKRGLQEKLVRAGLTGELADLAELHMEIMKEKEREEAR